MNKRVLAIGAHPDDIEQYCGGTLLLLGQAGYDITIAALTNGACGSKTLTGKEIISIRLKEAQTGAKLIGAKYLNLGIRDGCVEYNLETTKRLVKLVREINPQIIFTHPLVDYMTDHSHTGKLVLWALPESTHANFPANAKAPAQEHIPYVYHTDPQGLIGFDGQIVRASIIVDITDTIEQKLKAFAAHASQMDFLKFKQKEFDAVEKTRRWAVTRGEQVRVPYGEGFTQQLLEQYPRRNILAEVLGERVFTL